MYNKIIQSLNNEKQKIYQTVFWEYAINTTELCNILPIYWLLGLFGLN